MSKIYCLLNESQQKTRDAVSAALDYNPGWKRKSFQSAEILLGCFELPFKSDEEFWLETPEFVIAIDGEIMDWKTSVSASTPAARLLELFGRCGRDLVHQVNGNFTILIWDKKQSRLTVMSDRAGLRPMVYAQYQGKTVLASEAKAILADDAFDKKLDFDAAADFFSYEYVLADQTLWQGIRIVPYASYAVLDRSYRELKFARYWDFKFCQELPPESSVKAYAWRFKEVLGKAVERSMQGSYRVGLPLSGGLDSRIIAVLIDKKYFPLETFTFGIKGCIDIAVAAQVSRVLGARHHAVEYPYHRLPELMSRGVYFNDGLVGCNNYHILNIMEPMKEFQAALGGFAGDVLPRRMYGYCDGLGWQTLYKAYDSCGREFRENVLTGELKKAAQSAPDRFKALWENAVAVSPENPLDYLNMTQRQRLFINRGCVITRNYLEHRIPFADYDVIDFCMKMPQMFKEDDFIYTEMLTAFYPRAAAVPRESTGMSLRPGRCERLRVKLTDKIMGKPVARRRPAYDYNLWYRTVLKEFVVKTLQSPAFRGRGFFNVPEVDRLIEELMSGKKDRVGQLGALVSFELFNQVFIDGKQNFSQDRVAAHV